MNIRKILPFVFASALFFNVACSNDDETVATATTYENGVLISNEGGFSSPTSEVSFISNNWGNVYNGIYAANNSNEVLGKVFQTIGFSGNYAYLVCNIPNKIEIVNRYSFKKVSTVTSNLDNPRYIAFSGAQYYVTNNDYASVHKLNVYNSDNSFVKSINFDRAAEKVVEANGSIVVQTDGVTYAPGETATGYTISIVKPSTNVVDKTVTLPSNGIIRDLVSYNGNAYALASDNTNSYIYKINTTDGTAAATTLTAIPQAQKLRISNNTLYFSTGDNKVYSMALGSTTVPTTPLFTAPTGTLYGFDIIDSNIYVSTTNFTSDSKINIYNSSTGALLKTFTAGIATNGFYKN
ncbi:hypothetical protein [Chryseobacterium sp. SIMBA_029]|uniref:hypothetical protein n=1 Tax=Chryseobacterium sp. SIMBA_029 TaxID=3085772 RepID=UPI00397A66DF